ncbi:MAG: sigma 54-interacting transcriptional regulator [Candidatus Cloacimonetes bacterium]|nr:sigma 54-interacting transcriptional regulator [Candidatus Cloacimonadota bacterium]
MVIMKNQLERGVEVLLQENLTRFSRKIIELSSITEMDVCVVNSNLVQIMGTGRYYSLINEKTIETSLHNRLLQGIEKYLLVKPHEDIVCNKCEYLRECSGLVHLVVPIEFKNDHMSLMLTATKDHNKKELLNNTSLYLHLVDYFNKQIEKESYELNDKDTIDCAKKSIQSLINLTDKNVLIMKKDVILYVNDSLKKILGLNPSDSNISIQNNMHFGSRKTSDKSFQLSMDISGETKNFSIYSRTIDKMLDLKMVFVEPAKPKSVSYFDKHIFLSPNIKKTINIAKKVSASNSTILLEGESGSGKEVFADGIHDESDRSQGQFISVNCAAIPETLWESEFFGYSEGAFTGAKRGGKIGKFQAADKGTLFLDEIEEMPLSMQAKLLRVLETKTIIPVGSNKQVDIDVRIITATNKILEEMVRKGLFREDLFYRLNVIKIQIPPLRERKEDIIPLANYFLKGFSSINKGGRVIELTSEARDCLTKYSWPGNIRELKNAIEFAFSITNNTYITPEELPVYIIEESNSSSSNLYQIDSIKDFEYNALRTCIGTYGLTEKGKRKIEEKLGISRATLYRKLKKYDLR